MARFVELRERFFSKKDARKKNGQLRAGAASSSTEVFSSARFSSEGPVLPHPKGCLLIVRAQPRASVTMWAGRHGAALKLRVKAAPVNGKANDEIIRYLSNFFQCEKSRIEWISGKTSREKRFLLLGVSCEEAQSRLLECLQ